MKLLHLLFLLSLIQHVCCLSDLNKPTGEKKNNNNFRINFGSCNNGNKSQPLWPVIEKRKADLWIWGGDTIYADWRPRSFEELRHWAESEPERKWQGMKGLWYGASEEKIRFLYKKLEEHPGYKSFVESIGQENIVGSKFFLFV